MICALTPYRLLLGKLSIVNSCGADESPNNFFIRHVNAQTEKTQHESTKNLKNNFQDLNFSERQLEIEIKDVIDATNTLIATGCTLENALQATEPPETISTDNINIRNHRRPEENVIDDVQEALIKATKEVLELVASNKMQAVLLDTTAGVLKNTSTNKQFFPAVASSQDNLSSPEERTQEVHYAIYAAEYERMASERLVQLCQNIIQDVANDLQQQADQVTHFILHNVNVLEAAKIRLKTKLNEVLAEMKLQQETIEKLHAAIRAKDDPVKVVQTRLHLRRQRCGKDLCEDTPHSKLVSEIVELADTMDGLLRKLEEAETRMKELETCQAKLEQEICLKQDSIRIDKTQVLPRRPGQPSYVRRLGRVNVF
ncbi:unnamed protein product [Dibothriocephalus latus]|uniref:Tektin n=1 Tax=Dibothriocephalus latus TaxID=60516 RepID=A0A3P6SNB2_DIBLA|nr:unnamed protein product [Dibothriocephalus latus]